MVVVRICMMKTARLFNPSNPAIQPIQLRICDDFSSRLMGMMFQRDIEKQSGILLKMDQPSRLNASIHMLFMNFNIAVIWLDENLVVVDTALAKAWRLYYAPQKPALSVVEAHPDRLSDFSIGDRLELQYE